MTQNNKTRGWFAIGIGLIIFGGAIYGLLFITGIGFAISAASEEIGSSVWAVLAVPGLVIVGFLVLLAKVVVDRLDNAEDDHYSKMVDK
ncbi:MAG: hypothetical protein Hens3KO_14290 [Henriciella sp.]